VIDQYDIDKIKSWLHLAQTEGTDRIKIVAGDEPNTWIVRTFPPKYRYVGSVMGHLQSKESSIQEITKAKAVTMYLKTQEGKVAYEGYLAENPRQVH